MSFRHKAILNTHATVVMVSDNAPQALDSNGDTVVLDESLITAEQTRLQTEYDSLAYARSRKQEYDKLNQWEMQFDDQRDGTSTWVDSINEIKVRFPK
jgi:hypothetical protein